MSSNDNNIIRTYRNSQLIHLFQKNGYDDLAAIIEEKRLDGENFLNLKKSDITKWDVPSMTADKLWLCRLRMRNDPEIFLNIPQSDRLLIQKRLSIKTQNRDSKDIRLGTYIGASPAENPKSETERPTTYVNIDTRKNVRAPHLENLPKPKTPTAPQTNRLSKERPAIPARKIPQNKDLKNQSVSDGSASAGTYPRYKIPNALQTNRPTLPSRINIQNMDLKNNLASSSSSTGIIPKHKFSNISQTNRPTLPTKINNQNADFKNQLSGSTGTYPRHKLPNIHQTKRLSKESSPTPRSPLITQNKDFLQQLGKVVGAPPPTGTLPKTKIPQTSDEYLIMSKQEGKTQKDDNTDGSNMYDDSGYLLATSSKNRTKSQDSEENTYEAAPFENHNKPSIAIFERAPMVLPRETPTDDNNYGYIDDSELFEDQEENRSVYRNKRESFEKPLRASNLSVPKVEMSGGRSTPEPDMPPPLLCRAMVAMKKSPVNNKKFPNSYENAEIGKASSAAENSGSASNLKNLLNWPNWLRKPQTSVVGKQLYANQDIIKNQEIINQFSGFKTQQHSMPLDIATRPLPAIPASTQMKQNIPRNIPTKVVVDHSSPRRKQIQNEETYQNNSDNNISIENSQEKISSQENNEEATYGNIPENTVTEEKTKAPMMITMDDDIDTDNNDLEEYDSPIFNLNNEPFFRNTDRKGAKLLLHNLQDGAFVFRPCYNSDFFLTLTIKHQTKYFNLGIEMTDNYKVRCCSEGSSTAPEFATINDFISHFSREPLTFRHGEHQRIVEIYLKKLLPSDRF